MTTPVFAATPETSVRDIAVQLVDRNLSGLPVAERHGVVLGMVTEADIILALQEGKVLEELQAHDIMATPPLTVDIGTSLEEIMQLLQSYLVLRVPVTESGTLVGMITRRDCLRAVLESSFHTFA
jgi:predicted transcriptional regulator